MIRPVRVHRGPGYTHQLLKPRRQQQQVEDGAEAARGRPVDADSGRLVGGDGHHGHRQAVQEEGQAAGQPRGGHSDSWYQPVGGDKDVGGKGEADNGGQDEGGVGDGEVGEPPGSCSSGRQAEL